MREANIRSRYVKPVCRTDTWNEYTERTYRTNAYGDIDRGNHRLKADQRKT